jgi:hypothetical protein
MCLQAPGEAFSPDVLREYSAFENHYQILNISFSSVIGRSVGSSQIRPCLSEIESGSNALRTTQNLIIGMLVKCTEACVWRLGVEFF